MEKITLTRPDDWHLHVRDGAVLKSVVPHTARHFGRAIIMPNLVPPVTTVEMALAYRRRILAVVPESSSFKPLMTLYLTESTTLKEIEKASRHPDIAAFKLYPAGATTNSDAGVKNIKKAYPLFEALECHQMPLLIHGEVTDPNIDIFDREKIFIERDLSTITQRFPNLRIVFEHATTSDAIQFVMEMPENIAATITVQHLLYNRNEILAGGIRPHYYCLPILKREQHRKALVGAATSGNPKFFLGTDSAPHPQSKKENGCGCAGCYTAYGALELYAEIFDTANALDKFEGFASFFGADFYRLPRNQATVTLEKQSWEVPLSYPFAEETIIPLRAGEILTWRITQQSV